VQQAQTADGDGWRRGALQGADCLRNRDGVSEGKGRRAKRALQLRGRGAPGAGTASEAGEHRHRRRAA
jgi:hypothetical protein